MFRGRLVGISCSEPDTVLGKVLHSHSSNPSLISRADNDLSFTSSTHFLFAVRRVGMYKAWDQ